ncbi:hypothetical protein DTO271D3_6372 [Paecilomyces variotii]|nr:hypothetical protein DTO271D3_6372 [Paecilomyces variotii]
MRTPTENSMQRMSGPLTLELPLGAQLVYLAEGGANIVYRIIAPSVEISIGSEKAHYGSGTPPPTEIEDVDDRQPLEGKLLRLRKHISSGISYQETASNFDRIIRPLFSPEELIDQTLVRLPKGLIQKCNEQLRADEKLKKRPKKRHGVYLSTTEPFGLLITDMTCSHDPRTTLAELKPKWLFQSPSAPPNARRCRTCALREMKNSDARKTGGQEEQSFCPLDLVSENPEDVLRATRFIKGCADRYRLARFLYRNSTLLKLREHQRVMKEVGLSGQPAQSNDMSLSMTLRDCTMFIKMPFSENEPIESRLGDLDLKTAAGGKAQYWLDIENRLIREGWYRGERRGQEQSECALDRPLLDLLDQRRRKLRTRPRVDVNTFRRKQRLGEIRRSTP